MPAIDEVSWLQNVTGYSAQSFRRMTDYMVGEGVVNYDSYRVTFSAGLSLNVSSGVAYVRGASSADQGVYRCTNNSTRTVTLPAADATNPRVDQIVLQVQDASADTGSGNQGFVTFIQGTPTAGATLDNRNGAASLAVSSPTLIVLADVLVSPNNSPALSNAAIRDRRPTALDNVVPVAAAGHQMVLLKPLASYNVGSFNVTGTDYASRQCAFACYLPTRIAATHFRWKYRQDQTNNVGTGQNWNMAICDASARLIAQTGNVAFAGGVNTAQQIVRPFSPALPANYVFEAGIYYLWFGISGLTSLQSFFFMGWRMDTNKAQGEAIPTPGLVYRAVSGGTTFDTTNVFTNSMTDCYTDTTNLTANLPIPQVALSIS